MFAALASARAQVAPIAAISIFGISMSMSYPLFALLLERAGASGTVIGLNTMAAAISMVLFAPVMPLVLRRTGIGPLMIAASLVLTLVFVAVPFGDGIAWWTLMRFVYGVCGTALFFASEYWIVGTASHATRGRIVALYAISLSGSFMAGPLLLQFTGTEGALPFHVGAAILLAGVLPIIWGLPAAPTPEAEAPPRPQEAFRFFVTDPAMLWAVLLFAVIEYGTVALLPVWGVRAGMTAGDAVALIAVFAFGSMLLQLPLGWAADRMERRYLLAGAAAVSVLSPPALILGVPDLWGMAPAMLLWGGLAAGLYTIGLTGLGARYSGQRLAQANSAVVFAYGLGALVSPPLLGIAMDAVDPHGLLWASAAASAVYLGLVFVRLRAPTTR